MRIGLIADTHIREDAQELPSHIAVAFRGVDLILHAGDIYVPEVLDELESIAPVLAASGDDDYGAILSDKRVKPTHILRLEDKTLWLVHDSLEYHSTKSLQKDPINKAEKFPDIIVFGHTHYSIIERHNGTLYLNPGSPTDCRQGLGTVAILEIERGEPQATLLRL